MHQVPHSIEPRAIALHRWLLWSVVTLLLIPLLGYPLTLGLFLLTYDIYENSESNPLPLYLLITFTLACLVAGGQWWFVRQFVSSPLRWISRSGIAATIGIGIGFTVILALNALSLMSSGLLWSLAALGIGGGIGICQWHMIHLRLRQGMWWMLMTVLVWQVWFAVLYWYDCRTTPYHC